jgi:hypothetical protein
MILKALPIPWQPLYPSQKSGAPSLERGLWQGEEKAFLLQWFDGRVYFQLYEDDKTIWATLDSCAGSDALTCWQEALLNRRWGVCFENVTNIPFGQERFPSRLQFIYAPDGTGLVREWSSPDWIAFAPKETRAWAFFPELMLPIKNDGGPSHRCCQFAAKDARKELLFRHVSDEEIERLSWKSLTNQSEFERVINWLWNAALLDVESSRMFLSYASASLFNLPTHTHSYFTLSGMRWAGSDRLLEWLRAYFTIEGFHWHSIDWGKRRFRKLRAREPHLRAFFEPGGTHWRVPFQGRAQPSFHEQMEARLHLRDWLRDKVPDADIETLLASSTQT